LFYGVCQCFSGVGDEGEDIQSLEKMMVLRWGFSVLGILGPAVKMAVIEVIPWTTAWGMLYLSSLPVFELMVTARQSLEYLHEGYQELPRISTVEQMYKAHIQAVEDLRYMLAVLGHTALLIYAVLDLWKLRIPAIFEHADEDVGGWIPLFCGSIVIVALLHFLLCVRRYHAVCSFGGLSHQSPNKSDNRFSGSGLPVYLVAMGLRYAVS
jgi:hypothetical protein